MTAGAVRNDIYVTLEYGQYEKGAKRAERNVEVSVEVVDNKGKIISVSSWTSKGGDAPIGQFLLCRTPSVWRPGPRPLVSTSPSSSTTTTRPSGARRSRYSTDGHMTVM